MLKTECGTTVVQAEPQWIQRAVTEQMAAAGHSHVCHHRPTPTLGESASSVRFWIPCRLFLCYKKCSPSPMEPTNGERYQLPFRLAHCYWPCSPSQWKHIKVHLSAYNHKVHYIFYWAEYMFGAMGHSRQVNPFTFFFNIFHSIHNDSTVTM